MTDSNTISQKLRGVLFWMRLSVTLVMSIWVADKFLNPLHTAYVFEAFYFIPMVTEEISQALGIAQGLVIFCFFFGIKKRLSYGLVLLMHFVSTVLSFGKYFEPYEGANILFFAAWPMLAACWALYKFREFDTRLSFG